jgi:hypothetical protein
MNLVAGGVRRVQGNEAAQGAARIPKVEDTSAERRRNNGRGVREGVFTKSTAKRGIKIDCDTHP